MHLFSARLGISICPQFCCTLLYDFQCVSVAIMSEKEEGDSRGGEAGREDNGLIEGPRLVRTGERSGGEEISRRKRRRRGKRGEREKRRRMRGSRRET